MATNFSFGASTKPKKKTATPEYSSEASANPQPGFEFNASAKPGTADFGAPTAQATPTPTGGTDIGSILAALLARGGGVGEPVDIAGLLAQLHANRIDTVEEGNRRSQLPSYHPQSQGPWNTGYFKPMGASMTPEQMHASQGPTAMNQWEMGRMPKDYTHLRDDETDNTIGYPTPYESSFMGNSGDVMGPKGAIGRTAANRYGFGSSTFGTPQPPQGARLTPPPARPRRRMF